MSRRSWWNDVYFPRSKPIEVEGGIKARSRSGSFGTSWWARRWIEVLESFDIGARLSRGRSYARRGQVVSIQVDRGSVKAQVQGSRPRPYDVSIAVKTLAEADWERVIEALAGQALYAAKLLAGELPRDIEALFRGLGLTLFPGKRDDLSTSCSCPDWSNPCKHIAAAYYLLGEEFDRDPFLILALRGLARDDLLARLARAAVANEPEAAGQEPAPTEPLSADLNVFWGSAGTLPEEPWGAVEVPREHAALPARLGAFPFWRGDAPFLESLAGVYQAASPRGLDVLLGTPAADTPVAARPPASGRRGRGR
jgi:uncharacterized Zn finger protein